MKKHGALVSLALGGVAIGLTEFVAMGLLPQFAQVLLPAVWQESSSAGIARAGWVITSYALGVVVGAPLIAAATARMPRKRLVLLLLALFVVGTVGSALAPTFETVLLARFAAGLPHGAYFGAAGLLAATLMGPGREASGFAAVLSGLTIASLAGVPLVTMLGQAVGWRASYLVIAGVFLLTLVAVAVTVPDAPPTTGGSALAELRALGRPQVWLVAATVSIGFSGFFAVNSYIAPVTTAVTGLPAGTVPWVLVVLGAGMTVGNALGGWYADRNLRQALLTGFTAVILAVAAFAVLATTTAGLFAGAFLVGLTCLFLGPALQARLIMVAPGAQLMGAAVNQSAMNVANSLGAALGGLVIARGWGYVAPAWTGLALATGGLALAALSIDLERRTYRPRHADPAPEAA